MPADTHPPTIPLDDFVRRFPLRAKNLMWFLGAGASASAGIPTAMDMIWEFKRALFISRRPPGSHQVLPDLSQPTVRHRIDEYIRALEDMPSPGAPDEYACFFEDAYPAERDRQAFLKAKVAGAKPSYGHMVLATLLREGLTRLIWTTNFDVLMEDACARVSGTTGTLTTVTLDNAEQAGHAILDEHERVQVKLHGDFRSRHLKNTDEELRYQDARLRELLIDSCRRLGLVVLGYSGRDASIMDTLDEAMENSNAFPSGLFWFCRGDDPPLPRVARLLTRGVAQGIEVALISIDNFDETLRDIIRMMEDIHTKELDEFARARQHWSPVPVPRNRRGGWPLVRLNALPVVQTPSVCRLVVCEIGGTANVREAVDRAGVNVLAVRSRAGVLAFGADGDVRTAFDPYGITHFDLQPLDTNRQRYDSSERGLLNDALVLALTRHCGLTALRDRGRILVPAKPEEAVWSTLRKLTRQLSGVVDKHPELRWWEGVGVRLDWASDRLWVLIEPRIALEGVTDENRAAATDFVRERTVRRYNRELNDLIDFWASHLAAGGGELRGLNVTAGIDAIFRLSSVTAFSRRSSS